MNINRYSPIADAQQTGARYGSRDDPESGYDSNEPPADPQNVIAQIKVARAASDAITTSIAAPALLRTTPALSEPVPSTSTLPAATPLASDAPLASQPLVGITELETCVSADWIHSRQTVMADVKAAYDAFSAASVDLYTRVESRDAGESGGYEVRTFDADRCLRDWAASSPSVLQPVANLYGVTDSTTVGKSAQTTFATDYFDVVALATRGNVGSLEGRPPPGKLMNTPERLAQVDAALSSDAALALLLTYGSAVLSDPTSPMAQGQLQQIGAQRFAMAQTIDQARNRMLEQYDNARVAASLREGAPGWKQVQSQIQVGGEQEGNVWITPPQVQTVSTAVFDDALFAKWYAQQPAMGNRLFALFNPKLAALDEQTPFTPLSAGDPVAFDINTPPPLYDPTQIAWTVAQGWVTAFGNIEPVRPKTNWFETLVETALVVGVAVISGGLAGPALAGALGVAQSGAAFAAAAGFAAGAASATASGLIHENLSLASIIKGAVLGGLGGAASFGVGQAALTTANEAAASSVLAEGGTIRAAADVPLGNLGPSGYALNPQAIAGLDASQIARISADANLLYNSTRVIGGILQAGTLSVLRGGKFEDGVFTSVSAQVGGAFSGSVSDALANHLNLDPRASQYLGQVLGAGVSAQIITARGGNGDSAFLNSVVDSTVQLAVPDRSSASPRAQTASNVPDVLAAQTVTNAQAVTNTPSTPSTAFPSADDFVASPPSAADNPRGQAFEIDKRPNNGAPQSSAFEDSQYYEPDDGEQASRAPNRAGRNGFNRAPFIDDVMSAVGSVFNSNRSSYPERYGVVSTSGGAGNDPVGALVRALDLEFMDTSITPNVAGRLGSGVPYHDTEGNVFYKTYGPDGEYVGLREVSGGRAQTMTNALADVGLGVAAVGLRSNPYAAAGAVLGIVGGIWLGARPRSFGDGADDEFTGTVDRSSNRPVPTRNPGYAEGAAPVDTRPLINVPAEPQPPIGGYTPLSQEERDRMSAPVTTPIPDVVGGLVTIYPPADPLVIADLVMMSESNGSQNGEGAHQEDLAGVAGNLGKLIGSTAGLTKAEIDFAYERIASGRTVEIIASSNAGRSADFVIDGVKVELKTMSNVANQTADGLSAALSSRIMDARGQSGNIVVDARGQAGMTPEIALRGIQRAVGRDADIGSRIESVTIITTRGTVVYPFKPRGAP